MTDQCDSSVTAQSWFVFFFFFLFFFGKESTSLRHEGRLIPQERHQPSLAPFFYTCCHLPTPYPFAFALCRLGLALIIDQEGGILFCLRFLIRSSLQIFPLFPLHGFFPFLCLLATVILDSFFCFNYLTLLLQFSVSAYFDAQLV